MKSLRRMLAVVVVTWTLVTPGSAGQEPGGLVLEQGAFRVHSGFWMNLHYVLWAEALARRPPSAEEPSPAGRIPEPVTGSLSRAERAAWDAAVAYYDKELADLHPVFEMAAIRKALMTTDGLTALAPAHSELLTRAAPVYRKHWWAAHDDANRAWIKETFAKVAALSPAVPDRLARLYGTQWLRQPVRLDVVRVGGREGAYTSREPPPGHVTISSGNPVIQGWMAAEIVFHEASHLLAGPIIQAFATELKRQGRSERDLWHVALFYLTGEVVRQAVAERGFTHEPYLYKTRLVDRAWPQYRQPVETSWKLYINGDVSLEQAVKQTVAGLK